jgi:hypothetical protein
MTLNPYSNPNSTSYILTNPTKTSSWGCRVTTLAFQAGKTQVQSLVGTLLKVLKIIEEKVLPLCTLASVNG